MALNQDNFKSYSLDAPDMESVSSEYQTIHSELDKKCAGADWIAAIGSWDSLRRKISEWMNLTDIRFHQDTHNAQYQAAKRNSDELKPALLDLEVGVKCRLIKTPYREIVAKEWGPHVLNLWECDIASFDPAIKEDLVKQSEQETAFTELLASAQFEFRGEQLTLSQLRKYSEHLDRKVRYEAATLRSAWFESNAPELDRIFDKLVQLRHSMARKMGYENFVALGYRLMQRTDYDENNVAEFRAQVRDEVVPLCIDLKRDQAKKLNLESMMAWDEPLYDPRGNPLPKGDHHWLVEQARRMFKSLGGGLDKLFSEMEQRQMLDLASRPGKAGGGFCSDLPKFGLPFIFANFNGTKDDIEVFTHEMGHAFQNYCSRSKPLSDYVWPTSEACEIHSMGLEFLSWPQMGLFFGSEAERFCNIHLLSSIAFIPYGTAVDHFQHLVYQKPQASPEERAAMWHEMEQIYLPWRRWGDLSNEAGGRFWQGQLHIFVSPFYYIDYVLALVCALQFWGSAEKDRQTAMAQYFALCRRGGEAPFTELVDSAGLQSPFSRGVLEGMVHKARACMKT